ncbi:MAG: PQQ-binding-like beta-propeller repeat protein [Acidobacteriota bacterium]
MRRLVTVAALFVCGAIVWLNAAKAQSRGPTDWMTSNGDGQRSSWVRSDGKISKQSIEKQGLQFLWKMRLDGRPGQSNALTPPALLERLIGYRGFRMLAFLGGRSDRVFAIDTDLGRMEWQKDLVGGTASQLRRVPAESLSCPGGMTAGITRPTTLSISPPPAVSGGGGRSNPARSAVGEPGGGAVTLALVRPNPPTPSPAATQNPTAPPRVNPADPPGGQFGSGPFLVHALSSDGMFHSMHLSNGKDYQSPVRFVPANANATGLIVADQTAYVFTQNGCGGVPNGIWALDLQTHKVTSWKANVSGLAGAAFGPDGTLYVATGASGELSNSLVALDRRTLSIRDWYHPGAVEFSSTPVVFEFKGRVLLAATTIDGRLHVLDTSSLGGADHKTALSTTAAGGLSDFHPGALASWQDATRTRWILVPSRGPATVPSGFGTGNGQVTSGAVVAWKLVEQDGTPRLQPGWLSRDLASPLPPTIINDVVFVASGEAGGTSGPVTKPRVFGTSRAILYALDSLTGKELWNSGTTMTSFSRGGALSGGVGQIYVGTHDGTLYAFGVPMEH